jgi:hypothetical protein
MLQNLFHAKAATYWRRLSAVGTFVILIIVLFLQESVLAATAKQKVFKSPEAAISALVKAVKASDAKQLIRILGSGSEVFVLSGDKVQDQEHRDKFAQAYEEKNRLESNDEGQVRLLIGKDDWPFPFPLVKIKNNWCFDTEAGKREVLCRHIGRNELNAVQVCLAIVDAEKDYAELLDEETGEPEYARKFSSTKEKKDGLYWEAKADENPSPLGPLVAEARAEGYADAIGKSAPYHGYLYKILTSQGGSANGGAYSYIFAGKMIGGFAIVAFPVVYGSSGIHTFIVNHEGVVYQKDIGENTAKIASALTAFNPDETWKRVE